MLTFFETTKKKVQSHFVPKKMPKAVPDYLVNACHHARVTCLQGLANTMDAHDRTHGWVDEARTRSMMRCFYKKSKGTWTLVPQGHKPAITFTTNKNFPPDLPKFMLRAKFAHITRVGNCSELASCAAEYLWRKHSDKIVGFHIMELSHVDHTFVVVFDNQNRKWVVDPFADQHQVYPLEDFNSCMRQTVIDYHRHLSQLNKLGHHYKMARHPTTVSLDAKSVETISMSTPYPKEIESVSVSQYTTDIRHHLYEFEQAQTQSKKIFSQCLAEMTERFKTLELNQKASPEKKLAKL